MFGHMRSQPSPCLPDLPTTPECTAGPTGWQPTLRSYGSAELDRDRDADNEYRDHQEKLDG